MNMRIARPDTAFSMQPLKKSAIKDRDYLSWLHDVPCLISRTLPVEAAHLSTPNARYGHTGRGKGRKAPDRWALPLSSDYHRLQHSMNETEFWKAQGIDPYATALALHGLYLDGYAPEVAATFLSPILNGETVRR